MCGIKHCGRDMAGQPEDEGKAFRLIAAEHTDRTRHRERTMRMLQRIAAALDKPVEEFLKANAEGTTTKTIGGGETKE